MKIYSIRKDYEKSTLSMDDTPDDPFELFHNWFNKAVEQKIEDVNAFVLASVGEEGFPSARVLLLKDYSDGGFTFFTNYNSRKGNELISNPVGAMVFYWKEIERQVRIEGSVEKVSEQQSDDYFATRPKGSKIGALVSKQSAVLVKKELLENEVNELEKKYGEDIPRPENWGGFKLIPKAIEFWQGRPSRLHDRILYENVNQKWTRKMLYP